MNIDEALSIIGIAERKSDAFTARWLLMLRMRVVELEFWTHDCISIPIPGSSSGRSHSPSKLGHGSINYSMVPEHVNDRGVRAPSLNGHTKGRFTRSMPCPCRAHSIPLPCRAAMGLECVFPI